MTNLIDSTQEDLLRRCADDMLNDLEQEQVKVVLKRFVNGALSDVESERVLNILGENERCMDLLEEVWMEQPIGYAFKSTPLPDAETAQRIEGRVIRGIHRSNAVASLARFSISGFGSVASSLLKPFIKRNKWESGRKTRRRRRQMND